MPPVQVEGIDQLKELLGRELGPSDWLEITQEDVDRFADVSRDHQWIHVDPERAARESPYGTTVAHGNLTLSLLDYFRPQLIQNRGVKMGVNYGFNKVRFLKPVPVDSRLRGHFKLVGWEAIDNGGAQLTIEVSMEMEGSDKPVCVAESITRRY